MEFTKEVVIDCYEQAKVKQPKTKEEIKYNNLLDRKIKEENGN
jgi:hypothetical protein